MRRLLYRPFGLEMFEKITIEKLAVYQQGLLFLVVLLFPIQTVLFYKESIISTFSFYGQISSIPLLLGIGLTVISCVREHAVKKYLLPVFAIASLYVVLGAGISLHSILEYAQTGSFVAETFGETPKIRLLKSWLLTAGISSNTVLYGLMVFLRDALNGVREVVFAFGLVVWIAFLSRRDFLGTFKTVRRAVLWSTAFLAPYIACEVLHLFGMGGGNNRA